jgi:hypothetical protein
MHRLSSAILAAALALFAIGGPGRAASTGASTSQIRTGPPVNFGAANTEGTSLSVARSDHVHKRPWTGVVEATEVGVLCDGLISTDDSAALQAALNTPAITRVLLPCEKTCSILNTLTIPNHKSIVGCGGESSILKYTGTGTAIKRDGVNATLLQGFRLFVNGSSATNIGVLDTNVSGPTLRNSAVDVQVWGSANPPVAGSVGWFIHSVNGNSLYYGRYDHIDLNLWSTAVRALGDDGSGASPPILTGTGGSNANKWVAPEVTASTIGFSFEGYAAANEVQELHCNGGGQAFDQLCISLGGAYDATGGFSNLVAGNKFSYYSDNSVSGHVGKSYSLLVNAQRNELRGFTSGTLGTNTTVQGSDRNLVVELNGASGRVFIQVGNIQILSDGSIPGIFCSDPTGTTIPCLLQNSSADVVNAILWRVKANIAMTHSGAVLMEWNNTARVLAVDLNGAMQFTGQTFANLNTPAAPPNGTIQYCTDCTIANPCAAGGTGAFMKRLNGVLVCN